MHRMGLVDFWCYDNEEFTFENGHLLLRGSNGSGKSVTLQSFIPLLLDGNKNSERLDTFGSRSRKMETYLIDENSERDERIGYLYLEFKRADADLYTTIGMGLRARRGKPLQSWYFVIEDQRRVNIDFSFIEKNLTLSEKQLRNLLGDQVISSQNDYMRKVNDTLFGFADIEDYRDMINLLLQVRTPKLSNSLSPRVLTEILEDSLQPLSEDDLRPMSEAIHNMDNLHDQLEALQESLSAARTIEKEYNIYNKAILVDKFRKYSEQHSESLASHKLLQANEKQYQQITSTNQQLSQQVTQQQVEWEALKQEKMVLMDAKIENLHEQSVALKQEIADETSRLAKKEHSREQKEERIFDQQQQLKQDQDQKDHEKKAYLDALRELASIYENYPLSEHISLKEAVQNEAVFNFQYTKQYLKKDKQAVENGLKEWQNMALQEKQLAFYENQMAIYENQISQQEAEIEKATAYYQEMVNEYNEGFYHFHAQNQFLKLSDEALAKMREALTQYENSHDYYPIHQQVQLAYFTKNKIFQNQMIVSQNILDQIKNQIEELERDLYAWENKKEIAPERDELTIQQRQYLKANEIAAIPLYQLVDFSETLSDERRNEIEELFKQMHILDALVIERKYQNTVLANHDHHDYYLWTDYELSQLAVQVIDKNTDLKALFAALGITDQGSWLVADHYFEMGLLKGTLASKQPAIYIGASSRERKRQEMIQALKQEIQSRQSDQAKQEATIKALQANLDTLAQEFSTFRSEQDLKAALAMIEEAQAQYQRILLDKKRIEKEKQTTLAVMAKIKQRLNKMAQDLLVECQAEAFANRLADIDAYDSELDRLKDAYLNYLRLKELLITKESVLEDLQRDYDDLNYDISNMESKIAIAKKKKQAIDEQLQQLGYDDLKKKLETLEETMQSLEKSIQKGNADLNYNQGLLAHLENELKNNQHAYQQQLEKEATYEAILLQDIAYGLVLDKNTDLKAALPTLRQLSAEQIGKKNMTEYGQNLQTVLFRNNPYLINYRPLVELDPLVYEVGNVSEHMLLKAVQNGKKIAFSELITYLKQAIETQQLLINEQDREIFEDILVNTIGKKIRSRIQASYRWGEQIDRFMKAVNMSSGLQLSLKWKSRKADGQDELDTEALVALLNKDFAILKQSDREKISKHFRAKIEYARQESRDENNTASFHQMIREVMDYRQWFTFTIYTRKPNEQRRELTNQSFGAFSGGEKAIVMYVPLFSAVAARMENARADAPWVIALDEAFAGVDENNIENMFALIEKFEFDYIMTSQVLWGDYPTCKALAIYELFHLKNEPYITTIAYTWNGQVKKVKL